MPAVDFTSCWGLVTGSGGGTFNPTGTMQRAMLVTILYRMAGSPSVAGMSNPFKDVPAGTWYTNAVIWASHNGVVNGTGKTTFSPTNPVARQDIERCLHQTGGDEVDETAGDDRHLAAFSVKISFDNAGHQTTSRM